MSYRLLAAALLAAAPIAGHATTLIDGSFETKGATTPVTDYCYDGFATGGGPACAASPWQGGGVIISASVPWGGTAAVDGTYYGFVQSTETLSQTFSATSTTGLVATWLDANRTNNGGIQSYTVSVTHGVNVFNLGTFSGTAGQFNAKSSSAFGVTAGESYTLSFTGLSNEDRTAFIDNVSLTAVPEPTAWAMLIAGFGLVGGAARRRRGGMMA